MQFEEELNTPKIEIANIVTNGTVLNNSNIGELLFGDYLLYKWLPSIKSSVEITTFSGYEDKVKVISKYFNNLKIKLKDLTKNDIKDFYYYLKTTRKVKAKTIKGYHANIHKSLEDAIEDDIIEVNPADKVRLDKIEQYIPNYYTLQELEQLFEVAHKTKSLIELHILITAYYRF